MSLSIVEVELEYLPQKRSAFKRRRCVYCTSTLSQHYFLSLLQELAASSWWTALVVAVSVKAPSGYAVNGEKLPPRFLTFTVIK